MVVLVPMGGHELVVILVVPVADLVSMLLGVVVSVTVGVGIFVSVGVSVDV